MNRHGKVSMEKKTHILVVDDEQYITKLVERTLEDAGYVVTVANDGNSALAMLAEREPDLVLLDIGMPDRLGTELLPEIRASYLGPPLLYLLPFPIRHRCPESR